MLPSEKNKYIGKLKPIAQLEFAIQKADLELVRSIFKNPNLSIEIDLSQSSGPLSLASTYGHLDIVQYLMTSKDINKYTDINSRNFLGFEMACMNGWLEIVKYLTSSTDLTTHIELETIQEVGFMTCLRNNKIDILKYFIFDLNFQKDKFINNYLRQHPNDEVDKMFKIKHLHSNLKIETNSISNNKDIKPNKI
jgi:hypothetical protein